MVGCSLVVVPDPKIIVQALSAWLLSLLLVSGALIDVNAVHLWNVGIVIQGDRDRCKVVIGMFPLWCSWRAADRHDGALTWQAFG